MKSIHHYFSSINRSLFLGVGLVILVGLVFVLPTGATLAAASVSTPGAKVDTALTSAFRLEQIALTEQQANLSKCSSVVGDVQALITKGQSKGLDTSALSSALATFQSQVSTAQTSDTNASGILSSHNGFDEGGNVTDAVAATQTVLSAHQALSDARNTFVGATTHLVAADKNWVTANVSYIDPGFDQRSQGPRPGCFHPAKRPHDFPGTGPGGAGVSFCRQYDPFNPQWL